MPNHVSIWLSHEAEVGVKWKWKRRCFVSQAMTSGVLCVETLSRMTWTWPFG